MHKNIILWVSAAVITFLAGYFNSLTGDDLPLSGTFGIDNKKITYKFDTYYDGKQPMPVTIRTDKDSLKGIVLYRTEVMPEWDTVVMKNGDKILEAAINIDKTPGSAEYKAELFYNGKKYSVPRDESVRLKVMAATPAMVKGLFWFCLLFALFLSTRTGLEYFAETNNEKKHGIFTAIFFILYGFVVSPLLLSYREGVIDARVPAPSEIVDPVYFILPALWIAAVVFMFNSRYQKITALVAAVMSIVLFVALH